MSNNSRLKADQTLKERPQRGVIAHRYLKESWHDMTSQSERACTSIDTSSLFERFQLKSLTLPNRIVMPPMGVHYADSGVPGPDVVEYYRRRALGGAGLILTEGTYIDHPVSGNNPGYLRFNSAEAIAGWAEVVKRVHEADGRIMPELWHVGLVYTTAQLVAGGQLVHDATLGMIGPSGYIMPGQKVAEEMSRAQIHAVIESFARAAENSVAIGFDGVELHGAHGYLIDQFFWDQMNHREDEYGGSMKNRARFGAEVVAEVRRRVGPDYPILIRISQWKMQDYSAKVAQSPQELEDWLDVLVEAGVDAFDCSQRRFWEPEFPDSPLNFAGWVKKISGKPVITVGSITLNADLLETGMMGKSPSPATLEPLLEMLERGDFDMVAIGRSLIADPEWPNKVVSGKMESIIPFSLDHLPKYGG